MVEVHVGVGIAVLATNLGAGLWGGYAWYREQPSAGFWYLLRVAQATMVLQALIGSILLLTGHEAVDGLPYLYGVLPVFVSMLAEAARAGAGERELEGIDFDALPPDRQRLSRWPSSAARRGSWPSRPWSSSPSRSGLPASATSSSRSHPIVNGA